MLRSLAVSLSSALLLAVAAPGWSANRCVTPQGRIIYTEQSCQSIGARHDREVKQDGISVIAPMPVKPAPQRAEPSAPAEAREARLPARIFRKSPRAPNLAVCYDPKDARRGVEQRDVEAAMRRAFTLWNAGCNVSYEFIGTCPPQDGTWRPGRLIDYRVWWASWDDSLTVTSDPKSTFRDHALAAANTEIGVALNRDLEMPHHRLQRAIVHEFGHVVGLGHSSNPGDIMFSGGKQQTPTAADLDACNRVIEERFNVKSPEY